MNIRIPLLLVICTSVLLMACNESYPSIVDPEAFDKDEVIPSELEADLTPIIPTLNSPQFSFVTRAIGGGTGPFESWETDEEHWRNADFHVFAYQTTTNSFGGVVDMTNRNDGQFKKIDEQVGADPRKGAYDNSPCLLFDRIMHVSDPEQGSVVFDEPNVYYRINDNTKKYNFFTYYADNAVQGGWTYAKDAISCQVEINGKQDIMHSFAYHTRQDFEDFILKLSNNKLSKDQLNVLTAADSYNQILYSTVTGHRGIQPIFRIKHLLSKFNINVIGKASKAIGKASDDGADDFRNVVLTNIEFNVPNKGTFYIARDEWSRSVQDGEDAGIYYEQQLSEGKIIRWDTEHATAPLQATVIDHRQKNYPAYQYITGYDNIFHVYSTEAVQACQPILLPPMDSISVTLRGRTFNYNNGVLSTRYPTIAYKLENAIVKLAAEPYRFEPGKEYTINIYVYGPKQISIHAEAAKWEHGGSISLDEDSLTNKKMISIY